MGDRCECEADPLAASCSLFSALLLLVPLFWEPQRLCFWLDSAALAEDVCTMLDELAALGKTDVEGCIRVVGPGDEIMIELKLGRRSEILSTMLPPPPGHPSPPETCGGNMSPKLEMLDNPLVGNECLGDIIWLKLWLGMGMFCAYGTRGNLGKSIPPDLCPIRLFCGNTVSRDILWQKGL